MSVEETLCICEAVADACVGCGKCVAACPSLSLAEMNLGQAAGALHGALAGGEGSEAAGEGAAGEGGAGVGDGANAIDVAAFDASEAAGRILGTDGLVQAVRGCFFCTRCVAHCEADIDVCKLFYAGREAFQECGLIERGAWSSVQVDEQWHVFTAYRAVYSIGYADLTRHLDYEGHVAEHDCEVAFFPGCSLAAYNPELTRAVFDEVERRCGKATMLDACCGSPLKSAGFLDRAAALEDRIVDEVAASAAKKVVFACPGCLNIVRAALARRGMDGVDCCTVAELLQGEAPAHVAGRVRFFKSCQDRDGSYLFATRALLDVDDEAPAICDGCCGAGGAVSPYSAEQQSAQVEAVLGACDAGDTLVTMCPTCTYTQAFALLQAGRDDIVVKNYLELLFGHEFDWPAVFARLQGMWSGEYAAWLAQVLS